MEELGQPSRVPGSKGDPSPSAVRALSQGILELGSELSCLVNSRWQGPSRERAEELLSALEEACEREGLRSHVVLFRSIQALVGLSPQEAVSLADALTEKLEELLETAQVLLLEHSKRLTA